MAIAGKYSGSGEINKRLVNMAQSRKEIRQEQFTNKEYLRNLCKPRNSLNSPKG